MSILKVGILFIGTIFVVGVFAYDIFQVIKDRRYRRKFPMSTEFHEEQWMPPMILEKAKQMRGEN